MLKNFKLRLLLVIVITAATGLAMQTGGQSRELVEPAIKYVLRDYGMDKKLANWLENMRSRPENELLPVQGNSSLQLPCEFLSIERNFGWYWNENEKKQEFSPGVDLKVKENTLVKPVLEGRVEDISVKGDRRSLHIKHSDNMYSFYEGFNEILVEEGTEVTGNQVLGKSSERLHLEIRNQDGPLNPSQLLE
ncbi:MAG: M23 family metallopeptidase [Syntrophomonas sp.]